MEKIFQQLLGLFLEALPTTVIVLLFFFFLRWAFWKPLEKALAERDQATAGARQAADEMLARAGEKVRQYEDALRDARAEIYRQQEAARRQAADERARLLSDTRARAGETLLEARNEIAAEVDKAKKEIETESQRLGDEIARSLLEPAGGRPGGRQ